MPVLAGDFCGPVIGYTDAVKAGDCPVWQEVTRTWTASDTCGNLLTAQQLITIQDLEGPVFTVPANLTIDCAGGLWDPSVTGWITGVGDCSAVADTAWTDKIASLECTQTAMILRTWRVTDICGNWTEAVQQIILPDVLPPVMNIPADVTLSVEQDKDDLAITGSLAQAIGSCGVTLPVNYTDDLTGLTGCNGTGQVIRLWLVESHCLSAPQFTQVITLVDQAAPVLQTQNIVLDFSTSSTVELTPEQFDAGTTDNGGPFILGLSQSVFQCSDFIQTSSYPLVLTATDGCGNAASQEVTVSGVGAPLALQVPQSIVVNLPPGECSMPVSYGITASGICGGAPSVLQMDGSGLTSGDNFPVGSTLQAYMAYNNEDTLYGSFYVQVLEFAAPGLMICNDTINVSVDEYCMGQIFSDMVLEGDHYGCYDDYIITIDGIGTDTGVIVFPGQPYVNGLYSVTMTDPVSGNYCSGTIRLEDKIAPQIICVCPPGDPESDTCSISCLEVDYLAAGNIPPHLYPQVLDNCEHTVTIADIDVDEAGCGEGTVIVTWLVTDNNNGSSASCEQLFRIRPLTPEDIIFPPNFVGACGTSDHPDVTGWPKIDSLDFTDQAGICNLFLGYWDKDLDDCGGGRKLVRTWTVLDWCTQELNEATQIIKLSDTEGPTLVCPADLTVGTDFWYCTASVVVPKPLAYDNCSTLGQYTVTAPAGTISQFGSNWVIQGLEPGSYPVTWTIDDICGNHASCTFTITVVDNVPPVANCDAHTVVSLTTDGPTGITLVPAYVFDDGSYDNCSGVTFRARRMTSCLDIDWTTLGGCIDDLPDGFVTDADLGLEFAPCVPFGCCDVPRTGSRAVPIMVQLEVTDAAGNVNYCMVEIEVQDKIAPFKECPPDILVSCDFWFPPVEGKYRDAQGNQNGNLDEDPLSAIFGNMYDALTYNDDQSVRQPIIINDPGNTQYPQPFVWGLDGWSDDNCLSDLEVQVTIYDDCTGDALPGNPPPGAIRLIERRFILRDDNSGWDPAVCVQRIWVVDFNPFYIADRDCNNSDRNDGVIWPCDVVITSCPDQLGDTGEPVIFSDNCNQIAVTYEDSRFDFTEGGACYKILREWKVIDWCQYDPETGKGLWSYTQVIKVHDEDGVEFAECPRDPVVLCVADPGVRLPATNQAFLGENAPNASSCSVHVTLEQRVLEACSEEVYYDVKVYPFNGTEFLQVLPRTSATVDENGESILVFDSEQSPVQQVRRNGLPYNSTTCGDYHRILWSVEDGCGNWSYCEYLLRLEDCKQPSPVCINGLSTVVMPSNCEVTLWAKDFNASSFDDCTRSADLLFSFSGDTYEPSMTFNVTNIPAYGVELSIPIWVADGGTDDNCNGSISWTERNKDYCITTIVFTDNGGHCDLSGSTLYDGTVTNEKNEPVEAVTVGLQRNGGVVTSMTTADNGRFILPVPAENGIRYSVVPGRNDNPKNGVSTLDLVRIQKHLLGREIFTSPYQYIAADANGSSQVSALDLVEIRKLILGIHSAFPSSPSWRFVDKDFQFPDIHKPWPFEETIDLQYDGESVSGIDFIAVKIGDVNGSAQANAQQLQPRNRRIVTVQVDAPALVRAGDIVTIGFTMPEPVDGFQWTLVPDGLEILGVSGESTTVQEENLAIHGDGQMALSWNRTDWTRTDPVSFQIDFLAQVSGDPRQMLELTDDIAVSEAYTADGETVGLGLTSRSNLADGFALHQNEPNPWSGNTVIRFDLATEANVTLTVFDMAGRVVLARSEQRPAGAQRWVLSAKDLQAAGVLYYRIEAGEYAATKKMLRLE